MPLLQTDIPRITLAEVALNFLLEESLLTELLVPDI